MSLPWTTRLTLAGAIVISLIMPPAAARAVTSLSQETASDRAAVERAMAQFETVQAEAAALDARVTEASATLDQVVARQDVLEQRLRARVVAIYRSGDDGPLSLVLGATSVPDLAERLDLLERLARQAAADLEALKAARAEAKQTAEGLLELQADQARAVDAAAAEVARAKRDLAQSEAALKEYEARLAAEAAKRAVPAPSASQPNQQLTGSGEWQTGVASHYSRNFTGRGASGEQIGPYSMIVAHKTLPFGTLIEFEYNGKRAVARVADRGPYTQGRDFDLGPGVVRVLDFSGVRPIRYRVITR